ncbi:MAG TPA: FAD-binding oxidoreductase [Stellaceae bacterium]
MNADVDAIVIGGGLVGSAIAYGFGRLGKRVAVLDEGDVAYRATRGNFGLVWVQGKGDGVPEYARWSRLSADLWPAFAAELKAAAGIDVAHTKPGGLHLCLGEDELAARDAMMQRLRREAGNAGYEYEMLDHRRVAELLPGAGPAVAGASYTPYDGHANPLLLLRALHRLLPESGGFYRPGGRIEAIDAAPRRFAVRTPAGLVAAPCLVLAAGLGNRTLGAMLGLNVPVTPLKGQIMVTERIDAAAAGAAFAMPTTSIRQTADGGVMLGDSHEDAGFDTASSVPVMRQIAERAVASFPFLRDVQVVRSWAALRVMTPDGLPVYQESRLYPGAFVGTCHSGVTLAAAHALHLAPALAGGDGIPEELAARFGDGRFGVPAAA